MAQILSTSEAGRATTKPDLPQKPIFMVTAQTGCAGTPAALLSLCQLGRTAIATYLPLQGNREPGHTQTFLSPLFQLPRHIEENLTSQHQWMNFDFQEVPVKATVETKVQTHLPF